MGIELGNNASLHFQGVVTSCQAGLALLRERQLSRSGREWRSMPELPDIEVYRAALEVRVLGMTVDRVRILSPFVLRTADPPIEQLEGQVVSCVSRLGKRIVLKTHSDFYLVVHLMIAGRLRWLAPDSSLPGRITLASVSFRTGTLVLTEASAKKRASLHLEQGADCLARHDPGGKEPLEITRDEFRSLLTRENHTLKRALTDPRILAGIGNAYSDELLHAAGLSPIKLTTSLTGDELSRLFVAMTHTLQNWTARLKTQFADAFPGPGDITAFRPDFAVHGRYGKPCPVCQTAVQRIRYAENETNYCPRCQTGGRVLADRSLSRLLKNDWPRTIEELEGP
jgi:formamidopyrimidine-DNA glycosylase